MVSPSTFPLDEAYASFPLPPHAHTDTHTDTAKVSLGDTSNGLEPAPKKGGVGGGGGGLRPAVETGTTVKERRVGWDRDGLVRSVHALFLRTTLARGARPRYIMEVLTHRQTDTHTHTHTHTYRSHTHTHKHTHMETCICIYVYRYRW
jgi:hypothetical protein